MDDVVALFEVADILDRLESRLGELGDDDTGEVAGESPAATENRAVHHAQARLSRERARALRAELGEVRDRASRMAHEAVAARTRTIWHAARTEPSSVTRAQGPLGSGVLMGPHETEPDGLADVLDRATQPPGVHAPASLLAAGGAAWLGVVLADAHVELGAYDRAAKRRVAELGPATVQAVAGWVARSRSG